jgi:hypothetical protein
MGDSENQDDADVQISPEDEWLQALGVPKASFSPGDDTGPGGGVRGSGSGVQKAPNEPDLTPDQKIEAEDIDMPEYRETYDAALQGTSGKSSDPQKATEAAQAIAEEAIKTRASRIAELTQEQRDILLESYKKFFLESVQGLAGGNDSPNGVVMKAHRMSLQSLSVQSKEVERLEWLKATLPQPMAPDCEVVHGKVPGPKNHVLCKTHGHVVDSLTQMVIAHSVEEYKASKTGAKG